MRWQEVALAISVFSKYFVFCDFAATLPRIFRKTFVERCSGAWQQRGSVAANGENSLIYALFSENQVTFASSR